MFTEIMKDNKNGTFRGGNELMENDQLEVKGQLDLFESMDYYPSQQKKKNDGKARIFLEENRQFFDQEEEK